jgi:hypothetical protein
LVLAAGANEFSTLRQQVKRLLALKAIQVEKGLVNNLFRDNQHALLSKLRDTEGEPDNVPPE